MPYFIDMPIGAPYQISGGREDWESIVPDVARRADISNIWMTGEGILDPREMPRRLKFSKKRNAIPPIFMSNGGIVICSQLTRDILEAFDPGLHRFIPIQLLFHNHEPAPGCYYILNVHHKLDTIIDEKTRSRSFNSTVPGNPLRTRKNLQTQQQPGDVTLAQSRLTSAHLWRDIGYPYLYLMSDALHARLKEADIRFFKPLKAHVAQE